MKYCSFRLDWGTVRDGVFRRTELTVDGQMYIPSDDSKHLNWKELVNFGNDFESAWTYLTTLLDNATMPNTYVYFGCRGFRTIEELESKHEMTFNELLKLRKYINYSCIRLTQLESKCGIKTYDQWKMASDCWDLVKAYMDSHPELP